MIKIICVCGARPNFMKIAPIMRAFNQSGKFQTLLVHTGQHYDAKMSQLFFDELAIPKPDVNLEVGSGSHAVQTAEIMKRFEPVVLDFKPDYVLVVGDVNSTIACGLVAVKLGVKLIHVEAGLRSFDRSMPEEINRILTDSISDLLFVTEQSGVDNLKREGVNSDKVYLVGNVMIDTLLANRNKAEQSPILEQLGLEKRKYAVITLHRPSNVDCLEGLEKIIAAFEVIQKDLKLVFPIHPRTKKNIEGSALKGRVEAMQNLILLEPAGYLDFLKLTANAALVLTDSGGIQEETTILGIPCLTLRENTERPITITEGTNQLVKLTTQDIL
ncbi:MAG TPA: UDP-N-acetylglucosamine 2-epimerase (non-hydrolyzing), partial [Anaerohalosphaeraceae bacterium]|nr:UDP-N-acetylglucosamine 2-epimerase (non-hydrolyzing) [Anaerohalosphaeraceae bacterium]